jgi:hypothetical protein
MLGQALTVRARWIGSIGRRLPDAESDRRYAVLEGLLAVAEADVARLHGELALGFRQMLNNFVKATELETGAYWAERALASARQLGQPDLISAAIDAAGAVEMGRDEMGRVLELAEERHGLEDRVSTGERADAWIVHTWAEVLRGNLEAAVAAAERARAGLVAGQASSFVLGATSWRVLALHALGRWDEALTEGARAERAWQESELRAPWFAVNGFLSAFTIARSRGDPVGAAHWRDVVLQIEDRSDAEIRTRRLIGYINDDLAAVAHDVVEEFRIFVGRLDYVYLTLALLADRRHEVPSAALGDLIEYTEERGLLLVAAQARRLRGVLNRDRADLERALAAFEQMGARTFVARTRTELGLLTGDAALIDQGLDDLSALGDVEQAGRVATERRAGAVAPA